MADTLLGDLPQVDENKYKDFDKEALEKKAINADQHIVTLERRLDELRNDYLAEREQNVTRAKLEELIAKIDQKQLTSSETPGTKEVTEKPELRPEQIQSLVSQEIQKHELSRKQEENLSSAKAKLVEKFGSNYQTVYKDRLEALGLTAEFADNLAKTSPSAFINTLGLNEQRRESFTTPPANTSFFSPKTPEKKTYSYYQKMRKDNPKLYYDPRIANEMDKQALEQGEAFFDD